MSRNKCYGAKGESLYILEVFVDSVSLYPEKLEKIDPSTLGVDINLADFPVFRIFQTEFQLTKEEKKKQTTRDSKLRVVNFGAGKKYLFAKNPSTLVEKLREIPLALDVYKVKKILNCPYEILKHPLGETKIPLPGCLCDQVMMASNDIYHLPKSYEIKNMFGLTDEEYKPSGFINLLIRLTCFGKSLNSAYSIIDQKLLFKNKGSANEFLCVKVPYSDENDRKAAEAGARICLPNQVFEESELSAPPRPYNVVCLALVCKQLARNTGPPYEVKIQPRKTDISEDVPQEMIDIDTLKRKVNEEFSDILYFNTEIHEQNPYGIINAERQPCISIGCSGTICSGQK